MSKVQRAMIQGGNIVIVVDGKATIINRDMLPAASFEKVVTAVKTGNWDEALKLIDMEKAIVDFGNGKLQVKDGVVHVGQRKMNTSLSKRLLAMVREGANVDALVNFIENVMQNPSARAVDELYGFLEKNNLPLTPDGHFLAYKKVRKDYTDIHSGNFSNAIGNVVKMPRNSVDDDCNRTCSSGLHFASLEYMPHFGSNKQDEAHVMILKINPRDVVSIPTDYNGQKGRCCEYTVIDEHNLESAVKGVEAWEVTVVTPAAPEASA